MTILYHDGGQVTLALTNSRRSDNTPPPARRCSRCCRWHIDSWENPPPYSGRMVDPAAGGTDLVINLTMRGKCPQ